MKNKKLILAASLLAATLTTTSVTLAFLTTSTEEVENVFTPTSVPIEVEEDFDGTAKENVAIQNLGNISAYVRVAVVKNWLKDGNVVYQATDPYEVKWSGAIASLTETGKQSGYWYRYGDYYYYLKPLAADDEKEDGDDITSNLIDSCVVTYEEDQEYTLQVEILAQSVQSVPIDAIEELWNIDVTVDAYGIITSIAAKSN